MAGTSNLDLANDTKTSKLSLQSSLNVELANLNTTNNTKSYTSLRDILPSPSLSSPGSVSIRNRLVKQAAWAYLQPMSASPTSHGPSFLRRLCLRFSDQDSSCMAFIACHVIGALDRILSLFHVPAQMR